MLRSLIIPLTFSHPSTYNNFQKKKSLAFKSLHYKGLCKQRSSPWIWKLLSFVQFWWLPSTCLLVSFSDAQDNLVCHSPLNFQWASFKCLCLTEAFSMSSNALQPVGQWWSPQFAVLKPLWYKQSKWWELCPLPSLPSKECKSCFKGSLHFVVSFSFGTVSI